MNIVEVFQNHFATDNVTNNDFSLIEYDSDILIGIDRYLHVCVVVKSANLRRFPWDDRWEEFSNYAEQGNELMERLLHLVDEDTEAFNRIMAVFGMPKGTDAEKAERARAMEEATLYATEVPLRTLETAFEAFPLLKAMATEGNPASASDAGVGALAARAAVRGALLNVKINAAQLNDREKAAELVARGETVAEAAAKAEAEVLAIVENHISNS